MIADAPLPLKPKPCPLDPSPQSVILPLYPLTHPTSPQAHPEVAAIGSELAAAALASRRYAAAEPLCRQALAMAQHGVGMESKEVRGLGGVS